jgi:hypothetical protein
MFCSRCGKPLIPNAAFCPNCGSRLGTTPVQAQQPPQNTYAPPPMYQQPQQPVYAAPGGEETLLVLKATRKLSLVNAVVCHIVFKRNWLALAHLSQNLQKTETLKLQETLKAQNVGALKRTGAQMRFWGDFHKRYYTMPTEAILAEEPMNQALNYGMIAAVEYTCGYTLSDEDGSTDYDGTLHFTLANGEVIKFKHQLHHDKAIKELLTGLFGQRLKYKK